MYFANPLGLLGLLALPVIVGIHLYHRRFPPLEVAGLHLWGVETQKDTPGRTREKLPITRSLLLELLAALLISLLLADPRSSDATSRPHLVVVLDDSASMSAIDPDTGLSSQQRALEWLSAQFESRLTRNNVISVLKTGPRPMLLGSPRTTWSELEPALDSWQPTAPGHSFSAAWDLASQLAGEDEADLVFLTDQLPSEDVVVPERMEVRSFGRILNNVALTAARWLYDAETGEGTLFIRVANLGNATAEVQLSGLSGEQKLIDETASLEAGQEKSLQWTVPGGLRQIEFQATASKDPLELDHKVTLIEPQQRFLTIAVTLPSAHPAFEPIKRILGVMPQIQLGDLNEADLVVAPAADPPLRQRGLWWLGVGPQSPAPAARQAARTVIGPFLIEKQNPLMNGIILGGVVWSGVQAAPSGLIPVISTGSTILLGQYANSSSQAYWMNIDLESSNLTESPDWPIFWTNLMEQCRLSRPGFRRWNFHQEEAITFTLAPESLDRTEELLLIHGNDSKPLIRTETVEIPPRDSTGVYTVRDGNEELGQFAVNFFDREESNLRNLQPGVRSPLSTSPALGIRLDNPFSWLLVLGILLTLAAILANWYFLNSRRPANSRSR